MKSLSHLSVYLVFFALILFSFSGCGGGKITLKSIAVSPANPSVALGLTRQFTATGTYSDNSTQDLTSQVAWDSQTKSVATISSAGLASTVSQGTSVITATLMGITGQTTLTVIAPTPVSIQITPANPDVAVGQTVDFTAAVTYTDGSTHPPAGPVTWTSATTATASILSPDGIALALAVGTSQITVTDAATTLSTNTLLTVSAAVSRFAYVPNLAGESVSIYSINPSSGLFTPISVLHDGNSPSQILPDPSGRFAYALEGLRNSVATYLVNSTTGALTPSGLPAVSTGGQSPIAGTIDPTGRFLYVVNQNSTLGSVAAFSINTSTGALTSVGSALPVGSAPIAAILDASAKFLYVVNNGDTGTPGINGFSVNSDGSLAPLTPPIFATGPYPGIPVIDPSNRFLYVPNSGNKTISVYSIDRTKGLLSSITGSPFTIASANSPIQVATEPAGKFLFVLNGPTTPAGSVSVVNIVSGGGLGTEVTGSPFAAGAVPFGMVMDPAGNFVTVANNFDNSLSLYSLNSSTGFLTPAIVPALETQVNPGYINLYIGIAASSVSPADVFASNSGSNDISAFTVAPSTGALTATASSPVASGITGNSFAASNMAGTSFFTSSPTNSKVAGFSISQSSAALTQLTASPLTLPAAPGNIFADPTSRFMYLADPSANGIFAVLSDLSGFVTGSPFTNAAVTSLNAIVCDPQGTLLYALSNNSISAFDINLAEVTAGGGSLAYETTLSATGTWTAGAIDPSGHFLAAVDSAGKSLSVFQIYPRNSFNAQPDGALTPVAGSQGVATGATAPASITFDPLGRFVFVSDSTAGTVSSFAFNKSTGQLTPTGKVTNVSSAGTPKTSVDANGTYLYVSITGNPPMAPAGVAAYKINSDGSLTAVTGSPFATGTGTSGDVVTNQVH